MMMNIFSIFDPSTSLNLSINWISMLLIFILTPYSFWLTLSRHALSWQIMINFIFKEFKILINYSFNNLIIFTCLFSAILFNNFMGLFPYIFTSSSHLSFCLSISLSLWMGMILYSVINYFNELCAHLTPQGTPPLLMPFMVIIESVSLLIRPITLSVRLSANMIAGHLLLSLIGSTGYSIPMFMIFTLLIPQTLLYILELAVAIIQAYVFSILTTLYSAEA